MVAAFFRERDVLKLSEGKETWVGAKAVYRSHGMAGDAESLLRMVMRGGQPLHPYPGLAEIRRHCAEQLATLPDEVKRLDGHGEYPVAVSPGLQARRSVPW